MKKSSLFFIIVACIISVVAISFFGLKVEMGQFTVYMTSISITNDYQEVAGNKLITVYLNSEGYATLTLDYTYAPEDATYPDAVKYTLTNNTYTDEETGETKYYATVNSYGEVVFYKAKTVIATITTTDGSQLTDSVYIICWNS